MSNHVRAFEERFKNNELKSEWESQVKCKRCADCGFAWMNVDGINSWVFCMCAEGKRKSTIKTFTLPSMTHEMLSLFTVNEFPIDYFIPMLSNKSIGAKIRERMIEFKKDLRFSEKFWDMPRD